LGILTNFLKRFQKDKQERDYLSFSENLSGSLGGSGIQVDTNTAIQFTAVWQAMRILSESVAQLPINILEKDTNGDKKILNTHSLYNLLHTNPNKYMTKYVFIQKIMYDLLTRGNSYVHIIRNGASPIELITLDFEKIGLKEYEGEIFYEDSAAGAVYDSHDVLHFKTMSKDGYIGLSPIDTCRDAIANGLALQDYSNSYFRNGAKLSGVLETDRQLSTEAIDRLRHSFQMNYTKIGDSNKTLILEEGLKFSGISLSNEASQFLASRAFSISEVARIFSVPPHLLRDLTKSSFSNITEQSREFVQYSLVPYLYMMEQEFSTKLFKQNEIGKLNIEFNTNALLRGTPKERAEYYRTMLNIGAMSINEIRAKESMNRVGAEGDNLFMQMNMTTISNIIDGTPIETKEEAPEIADELLEEITTNGKQ